MAPPTHSNSSPLMGEALYSSIVDAYDGVMDESKSIDTLKLTEASSAFLPVYDCLFGNNFVATILKNDLTGSQKKVKEAFLKNAEQRSTVQTFISSEISEKGVAKIKSASDSGVKGLLWMNRALDFIVSFLENCIINPDFETKTSRDAALAAYDRVLKPYHGMISSITVPAAFRLCPERSEMIKKLGFSDMGVVKANTATLIGKMRPIITEVKTLLERNGCNFPDKV